MDPVSWTVTIVAIALLVGIVWWVRLRRRQARAGAEPDRLDTVADWPPAATRVLTSGERLAYKALVHALPGHMILAQVPLARFLKVPTRHSYSEWLRRLGNQCADLVICDMASEVIAVVSVEAAARPPGERARKRQQRMARVLKAARIPLHVWTDNAIPTPDRARELLLPRPAVGLVPVPSPAASAAVSTAGAAGAAGAAAVESAPVFAATTAPTDDDDEDANDAIEPPPSTWFDDFNSGPIPLRPPKPPA